MSNKAQAPMTPERWSQVKALLDRTLARPSHEREEFLRHACAGDDTLIEEVLRLATAHDAGTGKFHHDPTAPVGDQPDRRIGSIIKHRYRIRSRLGSGGVGVVYLAEDLHLMSRRVVVKFLHEHGSPELGRLTKFLQEAEALARLDHPGIISAFDADETPEGTPFLVMQYVEGRTLRQLIDEGPLPFLRAAEILRQLGSALKTAHGGGVVHRDLKPENIMVQTLSDGRNLIKLIDFGIARVESSAISGDTALIGLIGTPSYMAPEHLSGKPIPASDVFSVAVIAFEMLTGKRPFTAKHPFALRQQQKEGVPKGAIRKLRPEVPAEAEAAIRRALHFNAASRTSDPQELCDTISDALEKAPPAPSRSNRRVWITGGFALAATAGVVAWMRNRETDDVPRATGKVLAASSGAVDPLEQGFSARDPVTAVALRNAERTGFDRLALRAGEQGLYFRRIAKEDMREALRRGWKITLKGRPIVGGMWAVADFHAIDGPRYDVSFYREPDGRALALLCTQHVPTFEGPRYEMPDQGANIHTLELLYDPKTKNCDLFVEGRRQIAGYGGHRQQQSKDRREGFYFGISVYRSNRAEAELAAVQYEVL